MGDVRETPQSIEFALDPENSKKLLDILFPMRLYIENVKTGECVEIPIGRVGSITVHAGKDTWTKEDFAGRALILGREFDAATWEKIKVEFQNGR